MLTTITPIQNLKKGDRVAFLRELDREPNATVLRGERGTVSCIDADGLINIKLEADHPGLREYDNCLWIEPGYAEDIRLKRLPKRFWSKSEVKVTLMAAAVAIALSFVFDVFIEQHEVHASHSSCEPLQQPVLHLVEEISLD